MAMVPAMAFPPLMSMALFLKTMPFIAPSSAKSFDAPSFSLCQTKAVGTAAGLGHRASQPTMFSQVRRMLTSAGFDEGFSAIQR